jgi:hypothetical protein
MCIANQRRSVSPLPDDAARALPRGRVVSYSTVTIGETQLAMLLSEDDVTAIAAAIEPGRSAGVLVWENTWAVPFASAVRHSGGQLVASGRILSRPCSGNRSRRGRRGISGQGQGLTCPWPDDACAAPR